MTDREYRCIEVDGQSALFGVDKGFARGKTQLCTQFGSADFLTGYKGKTLKSELRLDLLVEDQVIVEIKAVSEMKDVFYKQTLTYCRLLDKRLGMLVNFNVDDITHGAITRIANGL